MAVPISQSASIEVWALSQGVCKACIDGEYENCYCNTNTNRSETKYSRETDTNRSERKYSRENLDSSGSYTHSISGEFISDNEFEDYVDLETDILPAPTTDWNLINSVLSNTTLEDSIDLGETCSPKGPKMQMTFVDSESDKESMPDVEIYYEDNQDFLNISSGSTCDLTSFYGPGKERNVDSRDSGFVTSDMYEMNIEYVTDSSTRRGSLEPAEISSRMLASLQLHEENEEREQREKDEKQQQQHHYMRNKTIEELLMLKEELEVRVNEVNIELVQQLSLRDELNSNHQALLMEADDVAKSTPGQNNNDVTPTNSPSKKVKSPSPKSKRRSWWIR